MLTDRKIKMRNKLTWWLLTLVIPQMTPTQMLIATLSMEFFNCIKMNLFKTAIWILWAGLLSTILWSPRSKASKIFILKLTFKKLLSQQAMLQLSSNPFWNSLLRNSSVTLSLTWNLTLSFWKMTRFSNLWFVIRLCKSSKKPKSWFILSILSSHKTSGSST